MTDRAGRAVSWKVRADERNESKKEVSEMAIGHPDSFVGSVGPFLAPQTRLAVEHPLLY